MSELERCVHQISDEGVHALFKEQWERCKNCAYDPQNNKRCSNYCPTYSPVSYGTYKNYVDSSKTPNRENIRA